MADASIVITTRNRREELSRCLESVARQNTDVEVFVFDDASTDGTAEMVAADHPGVVLSRSETPLGSVMQRNRGVRAASANVVVLLDDDSELSSTGTVAQTLEDFGDPRVGAVAIPYIDVMVSRTVLQRAPDPRDVWVAPNFRACAAAVRRDAFLFVGGLRESLHHQAEEPDLCLRMLQAGWITRLGRADPILHLESPRRSRARMYGRWARNDALHAWNNVPWPYLPVRFAKLWTFWLVHGARGGHPTAVIGGLARGTARWPRERQPVSRRVYRLDHDLRRRGPLRLAEVESRLPAVAAPDGVQ